MRLRRISLLDGLMHAVSSFISTLRTATWSTAAPGSGSKWVDEFALQASKL